MVAYFVLCLVVGCGVTGVLLVAARGGPRPARATTRTVAALVPPHDVQPPTTSWRRVGGGTFESRLGKVNLTWPFVVLEVTEDALVLRDRNASRDGTGPRSVRAVKGEDVEVFPARGMFGVPHIGVRAGDREAYFVCWGRTDLLARLAASGWPVSTQERQIIYL